MMKARFKKGSARSARQSKGDTPPVDVYQLMTDRVLGLLQEGTVPWSRPWTLSDLDEPRNAVTGHVYSGINRWFLSALGYPDPRWITFEKAKSLGGHVRKGETGSPIVFASPVWIRDRQAEVGEDGKHPRIRVHLMKHFRIFNVAQCEGLPFEPWETPGDTVPIERIERAEAILQEFPSPPPRLFEGGNEASYSATADAIWMPAREAFEKAEDFYATYFHELGHATGHADRLNRPSLTSTERFGSPTYSQEELIAEMTATYLCDRAGIVNETINRSAAYLDGWIARLTAEPRILITAAAAAQRAADYVLGITPPSEGNDDTE